MFNLMGYTAYKNELLYENHALLIEPIFKISTDFPKDGTLVTTEYVTVLDDDKITSDGKSSSDVLNAFESEMSSLGTPVSHGEAINTLSNPRSAAAVGRPVINTGTWTDYKCDLSHTYYYGTATEIFSMMKQSNDKYFTYKVRQGGSVETTVYNLGTLVYDDENIGGLINATGIRSMQPHAHGGAYDHMLDSYGLGAMHIWMKYILEGCPNGECPTTCPDGTIVPEGQNPEDVCPPSYCPDMQTVIPYGKTAAEVCPNYTPTCKYDLKTKITNDCTDGQEGFMRDIGEDENGATNLDEWKCIFDTANAPINTYEGEFYHPNSSTFFDNNPYCKVACRETVKYRLPSTFEEVAGRKFTIGISNDFSTNLTPNVIEGTSTCSTAYAPGTEVPAINYELFKQHYANANITVVNTWNAYQNAVAKEKAFQAASITSTSSGNKEQCLEKKKVSRQVGSQLVGPYGPADQASCDACSALIGYSCCENQPIYQEFEENKSWDECFDDGVADFEHGHSTYDVYTWTGSYDNGVYSGTVNYTTTSCGHHGQNKDDVWGAIQNEKNVAKAAYEAAVEQRRVLLKVLNMCNNFQRTYSEFEPTLSFAYSETKYKGSHKLAATSQTTAVTNYLVNNQSVGIHEWTTAGYEGSSDTFKVDMLNNYGSIDYIDRTDCNNELQPCVNNIKAQPFPNNISVIQITRKTYNYEIPNDANRYVAKNGVSYNTAYDAELSDYPYIDTGRSNMPINYTTPGGWYHYYYDYYYANGTANLFGTNQKFLKYNKIEPGGTSSYNGLTLADNLLYHCIYKVDCGLLPCEPSNTCPDGSEMPPDGKCPDYTIEHRICPSGVPMPISGRCPDNKGINIIYRTISLNDPFPGEHGEGRAAGANWNGEATVLGTNMSFIDAYITNNRGVETEKVYQETPMYQFTLTPANIRAIRKYNRSTGNDYNDYNFECSNGKYCKSEFLEEGIGNGYFGFSSKNPNGGSCFNAYSTDWESCRYSSIGG